MKKQKIATISELTHELVDTFMNAVWLSGKTWREMDDEGFSPLQMTRLRKFIGKPSVKTRNKMQTFIKKWGKGVEKCI
jgi:hypothetical protein